LIRPLLFGDSAVKKCRLSPKLTCVKGSNNIVADALSRLEMAEEELSAEAFANELANEEENFPTGHPLSYKETAFHQEKDEALQNKFRMEPELCTKKPHTFSNCTHVLITKNDKIYVPKDLQQKCAKWHHLTLMHPGEKRLELTTAQHHTWIGLCTTCISACKRCANCAVCKKQDKKCGLLPPKPTPEIIPWHTSCVDLVGPYKFGNPEKPETHIEFHCMTMIDPATGFFDMVDVGQKTADVTANWLEIHWLSRCPSPTEIAVDKGSEFAAEARDTLKDEHGFVRKTIASRNPQSNSTIERCHKTLHNMIRSAQIKDRRDSDEFFCFQGVLAACRKAVNSTVHATSQATPTQLVFGRDAMLNASFQADWQFSKARKQRLVLQNNKRENTKRTPHAHTAGDVAAVKAGVKRKHGTPPCLGPMRTTQVHDNGTVKLTKVADNVGAVSQTWNIRNVEPRMAWSPMCCCHVSLQDCKRAIKSSRAAVSFHRSKPSI